MAADKKQLLAMRMQSTRKESIGGTPYVMFDFDFLILEHSERDTGFSRHGTTGWSHEYHDYWQELHMSERADVGSIARDGDLHYDNCGSVKLYQAEKMVKTLKMIEKKLEKAQGKQGYPVDLADYASRLASAIGVEVLLLIRASGTYRWNSHDMNGHAVNQLRLAIQTALAPVESPTEELATA